MKTTLLLFLLMGCFISQLFGDIEQAKTLYQEAMVLMKEDHKGNAGKTLVLLKQCREHITSLPSLSEDDESMLMKVNAHIYWQSKFSTSKQLDESKGTLKTFKLADAPKKEKKKSLEEKPQSIKKVDEEWLNIKKEKNNAFQVKLEKAKAYEKKHSKDIMSNMLNYLDLQVKVIDAEKGLELLEKTEHYNSKLLAEREEILNKITKTIPDYQKELDEKNYNYVGRQLIKAYKLSNLSAKEKSVLRMYITEIKSMDTIKKRLLALSDSITMELPRVYGGLEGVIIEVSEQGFRYLSSEKERGFLKWRTVSDQTLLGLSKYIVDENVQDDLYIISLAHLRLKNYEEAYRALNKLITLDPKNYLKYRDYLSICETGYRLKFGPKFEEIFQQVDDHNSAGRKQDAMDLLMQFQKDFLTSELGQSYTERFKLIYHDVMRG